MKAPAEGDGGRGLRTSGGKAYLGGDLEFFIHWQSSDTIVTSFFRL